MTAPPRIVVKVAGQDDLMRYVDRIEFAEALDRLDLLVVELTLPKLADPTALVTALAPGKPWVVELTDGTAVVGKAEGDLLEVTYERSPRGLRLVLVGVDALHRLRSAAAPKLWEASHTDIVSQIAQKHGLTAKTDGVSTQAGTELQQDQDDAVFLRNLAREHHYYVRVLGKELHFKRWQGTGAALRVTWGDELHEVSLRASLDGLLTKVTVTGWDPEADQAVTGTAAPADLKKTSGGSTGVDLAKKAFGELPITLNHAGYVAASNAKARAVAELQRRAERFVTGTLRLPGTPKARAGLPLTVVDAGWPFAGTFLVREARHVFDGRYSTHVDFVSDSFPAAS